MDSVDDTSAHGGDRSGSLDPHNALLRAGRALQRARKDNPETARRYREANADKIAEYKANWREANREHIREYRARYNEEHRDEVLRKKREYMRREADKRRRAAVQREKARERERRWARANPERKRATIRRWKEAHPEKGAEYSKRYYERNREAVLARARDRRDANPEKVAAAARDWQQRNREHLTEWQRQYRASNPDAYERVLESNREARKLQRRLKAAGLPAKRMKRLPARERRANDEAARDFFERRRALEERDRIRANYEALSPRELELLRRRSALAQRRFAELDRFGPALKRVSRRAGELREDARMDSIAGELRGKAPLDLDAEVRQRVFEEAKGDLLVGAGASRAAAGEEIEQALRGYASPVSAPDGGRLIWVPTHTRNGRTVEGHWRRRTVD
jgi:hypothetical protein